MSTMTSRADRYHPPTAYATTQVNSTLPTPSPDSPVYQEHTVANQRHQPTTSQERKGPTEKLLSEPFQPCGNGA